MSDKVKLTLSEPIVVSQAPCNIKGWGYWQFPILEKSNDGVIHLSFHINKDSAEAYGKQKAHYLSYDNGKTWVEKKGFEGFGHVVENGDAIATHESQAIPIDKLNLPEPAGFYESKYYGKKFILYKYSELPEEVQGCYIKRKTKDGINFETERIDIIPNDLLAQEADGTIPVQFFWRLRKFPNNVLCAPTYFRRYQNGLPTLDCPCQFVVSEDNGHSWNIVGQIDYKQCEYDDAPQYRNGYTEPDVTLLPDGSFFSLLRTTVGKKYGPLMYSKSDNNMKTWSEPKYFDEIGVWPELLTLGNGVTLASYGRPGMFLRATCDPEAVMWDEPLEIIKPCYEDPQRNTCAYTAMIAVDDNNFLLAYSKFDHPDENGIERKSIIIRQINAKVL